MKYHYHFLLDVIIAIFAKAIIAISQLSISISNGNNRGYRDDRDFHLYKIDRNSPWVFDEMCFAKNFTKQEGSYRLCCFSEGRKGDREL